MHQVLVVKLNKNTIEKGMSRDMKAVKENIFKNSILIESIIETIKKDTPQCELLLRIVLK